MKTIILLSFLFTSLVSFAATSIKSQEFILTVTEKGFEPSSLKIKTNTPTVLKITRKTNSTCARDLVIPTKNIKVELPLDKEVVVNIGKLEKGEVKFGCAMDLMISGVLLAE